MGLVLASWVLLVRENLTSTSSVAKVGPWLAQLGICLIFLIRFDFYPKCANRDCQWSKGRRRLKGGMEGLDCLEPCISVSMNMNLAMSV